MDKTITMEEFLAIFAGYWVQTLDDKNAKGAQPFRKEPQRWLIKNGPSTKLNLECLHDLNSKEAGIFFSPNKFSKRRLAKLCEGINAWVIEMDDVPKEEQWQRIKSAPLKPSIVVESGKSLHVYYLAKNGKVENYKKIITGLIQYYNADRACSDASRVFRIPGFFHNKKKPFLVAIKLFKAEVKYTEDEILKAFPQKEAVKPKKIVSKKDDFWTAVNRFPNKKMLEMLSGTQMVRGEVVGFRARPGGGEYIDVNNGPADCWLDEKGLIGSGKGGGPTFVNFLRYYKWSFDDIAKWIKQNCGSLLPENLLLATTKLSVVKRENLLIESKGIKAKDLVEGVIALVKADVPFTWGTENLDSKFPPLVAARYMVLVGETGTGKTAFAFDIAIKNARLGNRVLYLSLEMGNTGLVGRYARNTAGISKQAWKNKDLNEDDLRKYVSELPETLFLEEIKQKGNGVDVNFINKIVKKGKYEMVIVDNFGFIDGHGETTNDQMRNISRAMIALRDETGATIIAIHHFRKKETDPSQRIRAMDSILGSAKLSHDVDFAVQVFRDLNLDSDSEPRLKAELAIILMKDRDFGESMIESVYFHRGEFHGTYPEKP